MRDSIPLLASALAFALTPSLFAQQDWFNTWNSPGGSTGDAFGYSVAEMGDLDSDGLSEVLVGAIGADNNGRNSGSVFILDGDTGNVHGICHGLSWLCLFCSRLLRSGSECR